MTNFHINRADRLNAVYANRPDHTERQEFELAAALIPPRSTVLDLGCGDGSLGEILIRRRHCRVHGIDLSKVAAGRAAMRGVGVVIASVDAPPFPDNAFDVTVLCDVLEHVYDPAQVLLQAIRVARERVIVAFPNFGEIRNRLRALRGGFPRAVLFGHTWYTSEHIRFMSVGDFEDMLRDCSFDVKLGSVRWVWPGQRSSIARYLHPLFGLWPRLFASVVVVEVLKPLTWTNRVAINHSDV